MRPGRHRDGGSAAGEPITADNWPSVVAQVCQNTGWTWDYVLATLTVPRLKALNQQWKQIPPLAVTVAAFLGAGVFGKKQDTPDKVDADAWAALKSGDW